MKKSYSSFILTIFSLLVLLSIWVLPNLWSSQQGDTPILSSESSVILPKMNKAVDYRATTNEGRQEYLFNLLKDPVSQEIPRGIRLRELNFGQELAKELAPKAKMLNDMAWSEIGPYDVSGRTRGLAIDQRNSNILLAGGAAGGIWKSTDGGKSWTIKSNPGENLGVTDILQHPNSPNTWYYTTGEYYSSNDARGGGGGTYYGSGIYKSTDNGESWSVIASTEDTDNSFNSPFDFISAIEINPTTGSIFFTSNAFGIFRTTDDFNTYSLVLGGLNEHRYADIEITSTGKLYGVVSSGFSSSEGNSSPGVYVSTDDGTNWQDITPDDFPTTHYRSEIGVAPSFEDLFYLLTDTGGGANGLSFYLFVTSDLNYVSAINRSDNIPNFGGSVGELNPQGGYNLVCVVSPENHNIVFIGGTNLFRSKNGFGSPTNSSNDPDIWVGGYAYANNVSGYKNHHPDQHKLIFDPNNPKKAFSAQDGGISVTFDATVTPVSWSLREDGYNVTQFYTVSVHPDSADRRIIGGTQDNGSPFFKFNTFGDHTASIDASSGDGSFTYMGSNYFLTSSQRGRIIRYNYNSTGDPTNWSYISPSEASGQLFIHPFAADPTNENYVAYPSGNHIFLNKEMTTLARNTGEENMNGWSRLRHISVGSGHTVTAISFSKRRPSSRLYLGGSSDTGKPTILRMDDMEDDSTFTVTTINGADEGSYIHDIHVNPENGNEVLVVLSNYEVESLFHSSNGGSTWTAVGGNLEGENGPSFRAAAIAPTDGGGSYYYAGTSIGLYMTDELNGADTEWVPTGLQTMGAPIIADLDYRESDDLLVAATHGRGIFVGEVPLKVSNEEELTPLTHDKKIQLLGNYPNPFNPSTQIAFELLVPARVQLDIYDIQGRKIAALLSGSVVSAGRHEQLFDAARLSSGTYFYRLQAFSLGGEMLINTTRTMSLVK
jgi:hypothetical protein